MNAVSHHPALHGEAPVKNRARPLIVAALVFLLFVLLVFIYRATLALYEESRAVEYQSGGTDSYTQGYFEDARFELEVANRLGTPAARTFFLLGKSDMALGKTAEAVRSLRQAIALDDRDAETHFALALALDSLGKPAEAIGALEEALDRKPGFIAARFMLAKLLGQQDRLKEAAGHYQTLAGMKMSKKQLSEIHVGLAKLLIKQKRRSKAQHLLQTAWYMDRENDEAWRLIMQLYRGQGREDDPVPPYQATDKVRSKIISPVENSTVDGTAIDVKVEAVTEYGSVSSVEVTHDGGHNWAKAQPLNAGYTMWRAQLSVPISDGRRYVIHSRAYGPEGLPEPPGKGHTVIVDNTGPSVIVEADPAEPGLKDQWYVTPPTVTLSTLEAGSLIFYRWNQGEYRVYASRLKAPVGKNRLRYFTRDKEGNESPVRSSVFKVKLDEAPFP